MKRIKKYSFLFFIFWFIIHSIFITIDGLNDEKTKSEIGVILGNKVNPDGTVSERLAKRLDKGIELYHDSLINLIIVSGGLGKEGHYEGTIMFDYLVEKGIPAEKILVDNSGNTTEATAKNVKSINLNANSVVVISQFYHISRTKLAFRNERFPNVTGAHADYFEMRDLYSLLREFFGFYKYLWFGYF